MVSLFEMVGSAFLLIMALMTTLWVVYFLKRNTSIVDLGFVASFILAGWCFAIFGEGDILRRLILLFMVTVWAGRLLWYLFCRYDVRVEDPRYTEMKQRAGFNTDLKVYFMFIFQGLIALFLSLPFLLIASSDREWSSFEAWGFIVWAIGVGGEALSDHQLHEFKTMPGNRNKVCNEGFWRWSRHPNYFFEWVVWIGFALFAFDAPLGVFAILSPALMYYLLNYVSGVPLVEEQSLKNKGDCYRKYQETTSVFFPWFYKS